MCDLHFLDPTLPQLCVFVGMCVGGTSGLDAFLLTTRGIYIILSHYCISAMANNVNYCQSRIDCHLNYIY